MTHQPRQPQRFRRAPAEANVKPHNREDCGSRRGNVLLARGLHRFDNWFEKDIANEQLGLAGYATANAKQPLGWSVIESDPRFSEQW
jgi:hypothetical protein